MIDLPTFRGQRENVGQRVNLRGSRRLRRKQYMKAKAGEYQGAEDGQIFQHSRRMRTEKRPLSLKICRLLVTDLGQNKVMRGKVRWHTITSFHFLRTDRMVPFTHFQIKFKFLTLLTNSLLYLVPTEWSKNVLHHFSTRSKMSKPPVPHSLDFIAHPLPSFIHPPTWVAPFCPSNPYLLLRPSSHSTS